MSRPQTSMYNRNKLKLGIFSPNCSSGMAVTKVPERWDASWENNLRLAQMADAAGIEFLLPIARWKGYGGETNFEGSTLETITWACGLLAKTKHITVFGTVHAPLVHPIFAAKQMVTISHVSEGRFGLNIVCGWNQDEFDMFGVAQREHDTRYDYGQEWWEVVQKIWTEKEPFDYAGRFIKLRGVVGDPKPYRWRPVVMNAGSSGAGRSFAARNCDFLFTVLIDLETGRKDVESIKATARGFGRAIDVFTTSYVVVRPTKKEAADYHDYYTNQMGDTAAVEHLMELQSLHAQSFPPDAFKKIRERFLGGHGVYPLIGTPDDVANEMARISAAGFIGTTITFVNYVKEFPYFRDEVLPRLERLGLREAFRAG
ncbi:MAG TPA: LLM class flavin-dependent oxidoreductase [Methylomirabilota bacterium]|nr:LLM class flavin-dependent oxidoreductase [Methylomirabilota bacterium]